MNKSNLTLPLAAFLAALILPGAVLAQTIQLGQPGTHIFVQPDRFGQHGVIPDIHSGGGETFIYNRGVPGRRGFAGGSWIDTPDGGMHFLQPGERLKRDHRIVGLIRRGDDRSGFEGRRVGETSAAELLYELHICGQTEWSISPNF